MKNPYFIDEPAMISFSGGRTSGFMLHKVVEAHGGKLPDHIKVCFANTGKEMPETLDFVRDCAAWWGVEIHWVEAATRKGVDGVDKNKYVTSYKVVDWTSANRKGLPFEQLVTARQYLPNPVARFCTKELKLVPMKKHMKHIGMDEYLNVIGIRADEPRRGIKLHGKQSEGNECYLPLYIDGITKTHVGDFWAHQPFDLRLPNNNGVTDWGNCDLCFLKGRAKRMSIISARPDLADWWSRMEVESKLRPKVSGATAQFRNDEPSYAEMKIIATSQPSMFDDDGDETIPCFCGD